MEERNIIKWSEYSEYTELTIPSGEIWMSESELVDMFGVFIPKLRNAIKALYKEEQVKPYEAERTIKKKDNLYITVYNMEVVLLLAFRLNSYQARAVRRDDTTSILQLVRLSISLSVSCNVATFWEAY